MKEVKANFHMTQSSRWAEYCKRNRARKRLRLQYKFACKSDSLGGRAGGRIFVCVCHFEDMRRHRDIRLGFVAYILRTDRCAISLSRASAKESNGHHDNVTHTVTI